MANVLMSGTVEKSAGDAIRIPCDFGNEPRLVAGASLDADGNLVMVTNIASQDVTVSPAGPSISGIQQDYPYQISARIAGGTSGVTYSLVYTIVLDDSDATEISRTGPLRVL